MNKIAQKTAFKNGRIKGKPKADGDERLYPAKKSLGQHFLHDKNIAEKIVSLLDIRAGDHVLEIGPGPGALTGFLLESEAESIVLLEKDRRFASYWGQKRDERLKIILTDALNFAWERLPGDRPWKLIGNLPYNVASPILWDIFFKGTAMRKGVFMIQKEVAERIAAKPHSKTYGALSVWAAGFVEPSVHFIVGPQCFSPPPKVHSAVIGIKPLPERDLPENPESFARTIKLCFKNRRKQLGSILRMNGFEDPEKCLKKIFIDPKARPENLERDDFFRLSGLFMPDNLT